MQEEQNGCITLADEDATLEPTADDGHRGKQEEETEKIALIIQKLNEEYGITFEEADRVISALKHKLEGDAALRAAFNTNSITFLRMQKFQNSINDALLSNADENLSLMAKIETDPGFGKFLFSELFKWYEMKSKKPKDGDEE